MEMKDALKPEESGRGGVSRFAVSMAVLLALLAWGLVLNVNTGSVDIPAGDIFTMVWEGLRCKVLDLFTGRYGEELSAVITASPESRIIFSIRMPRMLLAAILGGALSVSGFLLQTFFRNPIAGPFVLGISSGAKMVVGITTLAPLAAMSSAHFIPAIP